MDKQSTLTKKEKVAEVRMRLSDDPLEDAPEFMRIWWHWDKDERLIKKDRCPTMRKHFRRLVAMEFHYSLKDMRERFAKEAGL